jgi:hypothetical protein
MNPFSSLLKSRKFWLAVLAFVQVLVFTLKPSFPQELWAAINEVLLVLIISVTVENVGTFAAAAIAKDSAFQYRAVALTSETSRWPWLFRSRKFWLAVLAVVQTVVFSLLPEFPDELWQGINTVLMVVIGMYAVEDVAATVSSAVKFRQE